MGIFLHWWNDDVVDDITNVIDNFSYKTESISIVDFE